MTFDVPLHPCDLTPIMASLLPMPFSIPQLHTLAIAPLFLLAAACSQAQDWAKARLEASPRHHEYVALKHDNRTLQAFVVYPEAKDKTTVVILIHETFGLIDSAAEMADQLAGQCF